MLFVLSIAAFIATIAIISVRFGIFGAGRAWEEFHTRPIIWQDDGEFHDAIKDADRLVVLGQGHEYGDEGGDIIWQTSDPAEINEVFDSIRFVEESGTLDHCLCYGYPVLEWHKDGRRLAHVSVQHGQALRWESFRAGYRFPGNSYIGDARLTSESSSKLSEILIAHGVEPKYLGIQDAAEKDANNGAQQDADGNPH